MMQMPATRLAARGLHRIPWMQIGRLCRADSIGRDRRASGFAAGGQLTVGELQQQRASHSSASVHDDRSSILACRMSIGAHQHGRDHIERLNSASRCVRNYTQTHIAPVPGDNMKLRRSQTRALPSTATRSPSNQNALQSSGCSSPQAAFSPQAVQERLLVLEPIH